MSVRKLVVVDINDNLVDTFETGEGVAKHFDVHPVESWSRVQLILSNRSLVPPPDILLVDVSFDEDPDLRGAAIVNASSSPKNLVPVGPILALPFLNSRPVMAFAPYSAQLDNERLVKYPMFLVPMGLIAAKMTGERYSSKYLSLGKNDESLDKFIRSLRNAGNPVAALDAALPDYRMNLSKAIEAERIYLFNGPELVEEFKKLAAILKRINNENPDGDNVVEMPEDASLETLDPKGGRLDRISLRSIFADQLNWVSTAIDGAGIAEIGKWLKEWATFQPSFTKAIRVIRQQNIEEKNNPSDPRRRVDDVINSILGPTNKSELREILRLCVLFANVHAWYVNPRRTFTREDVYERLGEGVEKNTYVSWFGERSRKPDLSREVSNVAVSALEPFNPSFDKTDSRRYFLTADTVISKQDDQLIDKYLAAFNEEEGYYPWPKPYKVS